MFSTQQTMASNHIYHIIIGLEGNGEYGALFLNSTITAVEFRGFLPISNYR
jgi:hypothetical protein